MGLLDLTTNLKSLKFGKDRIGAGSSNQPYIQREIPDSFSDMGRTGGPDFLLRGGTLVPARVGRDVSRITQMFADLKSPNGLLFTAKQNLLASSGVNVNAGFTTFKKQNSLKDGKTKVGKLLSQAGDFIENNIGINPSNIYTPLSTIAQVAVGPIGGHLNKQGLIPFTPNQKLLDGINKLGEKSGLKEGTKDKIEGFLKSASQTRYQDIGLGLNNLGSRNGILLDNGKLSSIDTDLYEYVGGPGAILGVGRTRLRRWENSIDQQLQTKVKTGALQNYTSLTHDELLQKSDETRFEKGKIVDFRKKTWPIKNIEARVNLGNPADKNRDKGEALDKINALAMYKAANVKEIQEKNDLVKFRIAIFDNENPNNKTYIHFRALIDSLSDSYSAEWNGERFLGRGENFYHYNGFTRTINLAWTVAAQSRPELIPQYQKLNYLASSLAPDYSQKSGYMRGNLAELTVGGWCFNQPGIIQSMTLDVPSESPWEIGISAQEDENTLNTGQESVKSFKGVKELPHIVKVTNFTFIPIHNFVPQVQQNDFKGKGSYLSKFGKERYIALDSGDKSNNYDYANYVGKNQY